MVSGPSQTLHVTVEHGQQRLVTADQVREHIGSNSADTDEVLDRLIDEADAEVVSRYGPHSIDGPVTEVHGGGSFRLFPHRAVKEIDKVTETDGNVSVVLSARRLSELVWRKDATTAGGRQPSSLVLG